MRSLTSGFASEAAKLTGAAPVWIFKLTVNGDDYYISDDVFTVAGWNGGVTTLAWVETWGTVRESLSGAIDEIKIADFDLTILDDPDASPGIVALVTGYDVEAQPAQLYLWFRGLDAATDPPLSVFRGYVRDVAIPDETRVNLVIEDESLRLENYVGTKVALDVYPDADPDDVGKLIPIVYGSVDKLRALAIVAGTRTGLDASIDAVQTTITVSDATGLASGDIIQVDNELMLIGSVSGDELSVTRAHGVTVATTHYLGAVVSEIFNEFAYLVSDRPLSSIGKIYGEVGQVRLNITAICTKYTGQIGNEHAEFPGMGLVTLPGIITVAQAIDLLVAGGLTLENTLELLDELGVSDTITVYDTIEISDGEHTHTLDGGTLITSISPDTIAPNNANNYPLQGGENPYNWVDKNLESYAIIGSSTTYGDRTQKLTNSFPIAVTGAPTRARLCVHACDYQDAGSVIVSGACCGNSVSVTHTSTTASTVKSSWVTLTNKTWTDFSTATSTYINVNDSTANYQIFEIWWEVEYSTTISTEDANISKSGSATKGGSATRTGNITLTGDVALSGDAEMSGNSTVNTLVADALLVDVVGELSSPSEVFEDLLDRSNISAPVQVVGSLPAVCRFDGAITEYQQARVLLEALAFQCRSWFRMIGGAAVLRMRSDPSTAVAVISAAILEQDGRRRISREKTGMDDVVNKIQVLYNRDYSLENVSDNSYRGASSATDAASIAVYGERERPNLFQFDFVYDVALAEHLRDFYLAWYKDRHWKIGVGLFLDKIAIEFGDVVQLDLLASQIGTVTECAISPGSADTCDTISLTVVV